MSTNWLDISDTTPRIAYTATAGQTLFTVPFAFFENSNLRVYKNTVLLTLGTDYSASGAEVAIGGRVALVTGATAGDKIMIVREVPIEQTTHFPPTGPFDIPALNIQFSRIIAMIQQVLNLFSRAIHFPDSDSTLSGVLASAAARAGKLMGFGTNGEIIYAVGPTFVGETATGVAHVDSGGTLQVTSFAGSVNIVITAGYAIPGDGGWGTYVRVVSNPGHPASFRSGDGAYWELDRSTGVIPNHVGRVGVNAATDTATIDAWLSCLAAGYSSGRWLGETYQVNGTRLKVLVGKRIIVDGGGSKLVQQQTFANTLHFQRCAFLEVFGFDFTGYGAINPATEYHGDPGDVNPGSFANVSAVSAFACDKVIIHNNKSRYHVGFDFLCVNCLDQEISKNKCQGVGAPTIKDGDLGTAAIGISWDGDATYGLPTISKLVGIAHVSKNRIYDHSFGVLAAFNSAIECKGNNIGPITGQHPFYLTGNNGVHVHHNECHDAGEIGIKVMMSRDHLPFMNIPNWAPFTGYVTDQDVREGNNIYRAPSNFTSAATFGADTLWEISPLQNHEGCHIHDNEIHDCQEGVHVVAGPSVIGYNMKYKGVAIHHNTIRRIENYAVKAEYWDGAIDNNRIEDVDYYAIYAPSGGGLVSKNQIYRSGRTGILLQPTVSTEVSDNLLEDCGLGAAATFSDRIPMRVLDLQTPSDHPGRETNPKVEIKGNDQRWVTASGPNGGEHSIETGPTIRASFISNRSNSLASAKVDGTLVFAEDNSFPFDNTDMNDPATFREGRPGRVFRGRQNPQAAGSTEPYFAGEECKNTHPTSGQPFFWVCTVGGTPGTWVAGPLMA